MNSCAPAPPIIPTSDSTTWNATPDRRKIRLYASFCFSYATSRPASSTSRVYASFIQNSRVRRTPERGRASSRSFVWIWYQTCGSSR